MHPLLEGFDQILNAPLRDLDDILPGKGAWADAVDAQVPDEDQPDLPELDTRQAYIYDRVGQWAGNPHDLERTEALVRTYVFDRDDYALDALTVNRNEESARAFVNLLINLALKEKAMLHAGDASTRANRYFVFLHGKHGSGKTFLINYLLARYARLLDDSRVIWVRVDMNEAFDGNVLHRIYAQVTKLIMRYYDPKSHWYQRPIYSYDPTIRQFVGCVGKPIELSVADDLRAYVRSAAVAEEARPGYFEAIDNMVKAFQGSIKESLTGELVPQPLGRRAFAYARDQGYAFVVLIDGLDKLEATAVNQSRFKRLMKETVQLARQEEASGFALVIISSTSTINSSPDLFVHAGPGHYPRPVEKKVCPVSFNELLNKRKEYIIAAVKKLAPERGWETADWPKHLDDFCTYLWNSSDFETNYTEYIASFGENRRAQTQLVQIAYLYWLRDLHHKEYALIEGLSRAGRRFPPKHYVFAIRGHRDWIRLAGSSTQYDNRLMPSIFSYPYLACEVIGNQLPEAPNRYGVLLGLRILQLVSAHRRLIAETAAATPLYAREVAEMCNTLFGYRKNLTYFQLEHFEEFELIRVTSDDFTVSSPVERRRVYPLPKLDYVLRRFIYDAAYLNFAAMRVPLRKDALSFDCERPYFRAATIIPRGDDLNPPDEKDKLIEWIATKLFNTAHLFKLVDAINNIQRGGFEGKAARLGPRLRETSKKACQPGQGVAGMFEFVGPMREQILAQVRAIEISLRTADRGMADSVLQKLMVFDRGS